MKYEFKVGDKLRVVYSGSGNTITNGMIVTCNTTISTDEENGGIYVVMPNGKSSGGWNVSRFEKVKSDYKPKNPTHLVVWEEDRDPTRFFTSEKEAKDFIKKLSDKSNVEKDSILLIEIKSCKKIQINKVLRYNQHKI